MYIKGVGMTKFGIQGGTSQELVYEAAMEALDDADIKLEDIDAIVSSIVDSESNGERQRGFSSVISSIFKKKIPIITTSAVCGGGGAALWTANRLDYDNVLVMGVERLLSNNSQNTTHEIMMAGERIYEQAEGLIFPAQNALVAQQYMLKYGATTDDFALVALKNHQNAFYNPKARFYRKEVTLKHLSVNGAAAAVLTKQETDINIVSSSLYTDRLSTFESEDMTSWEATRLAANDSYRQAGICPSDIDIVEIHDAFTPVEVISYEDLGFCKKGEGKNMIRKGITNYDGELPVNVSGGLKAKGHPISATGIAQIYELARQMRGHAEGRQVDDVKYALAQNIGGAGSTVSVHILKKVSI
ncbi:thiolase family protein [Candidatus Woesearchaeota archaeon]|nr:thiolase family protein [Candidatus Woesearchaeota archaeon]